MKKLNLLLFILIVPLIFTYSCKSKEDKAAELVKNELSKTLYDFESYEPIETKVSEAYQTAYNDTTCYRMALAITYVMDKTSKALDEANDAREHADIWGPPTYYSSSYSDNQYRKYINKAKEKSDEALRGYELFKTMSSSLEDSTKVLDNNKVIGWEIKHRFRCKTKGGQSTIADYRFVVDPDIKTVYFSEDIDDTDYKHAREIIDAALKGELTNKND
ncbi:MAG: hypothetical protein K2N79_03410 [Muribaculaceae bacterium]|nr:hypothetical protein [Muribaculaceae bacterium]MDE7368912.1 hypothetical protein [Muribaculaceae bacterium]